MPAIARLVKKGKIVRSTGYRDELHVAALPARNAEKCAGVIRDIFDKRTKVIPSLLNLTMTPSNPILHTARLRALFADWHEGIVYDRIPLFYEEWDDASSELLLACDEEVQRICKALPELDLKYVKSLRKHYESNTVREMTNKIRSISAFKGIKTPAAEVEGGLIPDLHSRYFISDFSYGLAIIKQIAEFAGVQTPDIDETMEWYRKIAIDNNMFHFSDYGINNLEELREFYLM